MRKKDLTDNDVRRLFVLRYYSRLPFKDLVKEYQLSEKCIKQSIETFMCKVYDEYLMGMTFDNMIDKYSLSTDQGMLLLRMARARVSKFENELIL